MNVMIRPPVFFLSTDEGSGKLCEVLTFSQFHLEQRVLLNDAITLYILGVFKHIFNLGTLSIRCQLIQNKENKNT